MVRIPRRSLLKGGLGLAATGLAGGFGLTACASTPSQPVRPLGQSVEDILADGARVMWVAAHPDDEALVGAILARSSLVYRNPLYFLILTRGDGGECCKADGCKPDLPTVRSAEMNRVAELYRAELQLESYFNAPLPMESFPPRHKLAEIWRAHKDPALVCAESIRRFRPDLIFTFDPYHGFTGHPEHQLASRFCMEGVRLAARNTPELPGNPHRTTHLYCGLNRYFPLTFFGMADPGPVTETWRADTSCGNGWLCRDVMGEISRMHESQENDMGMVRRLVPFMRRVYLRKINPFTEYYDPYEPV